MFEKIQEQLKKDVAAQINIVALTGAGISAESGIPTFRGPEGYWTVGSTVYRPQEMATFHMFTHYPEEVWQWYLYRMGVCAQALPNAGHQALVDMEKRFGKRFTLITQNVDGLHLRAGNSPERTLQIHGNVFFMRCSLECSPAIYPIPKEVQPKTKDEPLTDKDKELLICPLCGARSRPHILLFDEVYNEEHYHFHSALKAAREAGLLIVVGTSGSTNLPNQVVREVYHRGGRIIDINIDSNPFGDLAASTERGCLIRQPGTRALPALLQAMT